MLRIITLILTILISAGSAPAQEQCGKTNNKKAQKLYKEAISFLNQNRYQSALGLLQEASDKDPGFADAYYLIAHIYSQQNVYVKSRDNFLEVLDVCEDYDPEIYLNLSKIEFGLQNYENASIYAKRFLEKDLLNANLLEEAEKLLKKSDFYSTIFSNPVPFNPKPLTNICTKYDEYLPMLTPDNDFLFFTRRHKKDSKFTVIGDAWVEDFCMAERRGADFSQGMPLSKPFNQSNNEGGASLSSDNKNLFLTICNSPKGAGSCDIYYSKKDGENWADLFNLGSEVNDSMWQSQVSIAPDGKTLYFASDMDGGYGGKDIYITKQLDNGTWSAPINLGPVINTTEDEKSPFIHQDGLTLYFSSTGHMGIGGFDIFISRRNESNVWSEVQNIGFPINSDFDDLGFFVSTNGKTGYFASNKLEGKGGWDIYKFDLYEGAQPKKVLFVKGSVKDEEGKVLSGAKIQLKDPQTKEIQNIEVDSLTGEYVYSEIYNNDKMLTVNKEGFFYNEKLITEQEIDEKGSIKFDAELDKLEIGGSFRLEKILFDTDKYDLNERPKQSLENLVQFLIINNQLQIEIAGHTDDVGNNDENQLLSENRARVVYEFLLEKGIDISRMQYTGYGEDQPLIENLDNDSRALNRRTEIRIIGNM